MERARVTSWVLGAAALALALTGCGQDAPVASPSPSPVQRPKVAEPAVPDAGPSEPSEASRALTDYYSRIQERYLAQGLLRVDGGGPDTPVTSRQLAENFVRIALFEEFTSVGERMVRAETASRLHRWAGPIRMDVRFGDSVAAAKRRRDLAEIQKFSARLARLTGLSIQVTEADPNFFVYIVNEEERRALGPTLRRISPEVDTAAINTVENMRRSTLCLVFSIDGETNGIYSTSVAIIRAEHPDLLRLSCIHEELAQGLGLPNDSPLARPSVFNDDEEFGLLTTHDEYLLKMLYDPRMRPGMTADEARPVAELIAAELLGGEG